MTKASGIETWGTEISHSEVECGPSIHQVAILLMMIGGEASGSILRELDEDEVQEIRREIARVKTLTPEEAEGVLEEFYKMAVTQDCLAKGGVDSARQVLIEAFGPEQAQAMIDRYTASSPGDPANRSGDPAPAFDALQRADPRQLAEVIHREHPQTIALVLSHLCPSRAAALLFTLPEDLQADVSLRMATEDQISPEVVSKIAAVVGSKLTSLSELARDSYGGVQAVAEIFNELDSGCCKNILGNIGALNPGLLDTIRHLMFVFEDLPLLDAKAVEEVLAKVDRRHFIVALQGASDQVKNGILKGMSERSSKALRAEMNARPPAGLKEIEGAQHRVTAVVRRLESDGVIRVKRPPGRRDVL